MKKYKSKIRSWSNANKSVIRWDELQEVLSISEYEDLVLVVKSMVQEGVLKGMGCTFNGRKPSMHSKYRILSEDVDYSEYVYELDYVINPVIDKRYYRKNIKSYVENREDILKINKFISDKKNLLDISVSVNERSFQIFGKEKQLRRSKVLMKNLGLSEEFFNYYETSEPIAYYSVSKKSPQNILIIENKDTFYTMRKYMREESSLLLGVEISTIVYGGGKSKIPSLNEFKYYTEDYISDINNTFYYFGDLDYEGLVIYESYRSRTAEHIDLKPFVPAYEYIIDKCIENIDDLPTTKLGQNRNIADVFFDGFDDIYKSRMNEILEKDKYIPQEALNYGDLIDYNRRR